MAVTAPRDAGDPVRQDDPDPAKLICAIATGADRAALAASPGHSHTGAAMARILQGGYADETGDYGALDIAEGDPALEHTPIASPGPECICPIATTGRPQAHTCVARLVQPLVGV